MRRCYAVLLALLSSACAGVPGVELPQAPSRPLVVATYAYPERDRAAAIRPLADYLGRRRDREVVVRVLPSPAALVDALARGEVDVAVPNLYGYLRATAAGSAAIGLPVPDVPPAQADDYRSVLIAREAVVDMADLSARAPQLRLALVGADSASGGLVPRRRLADAGIVDLKARFATVDYVGSHDAALAAVADGRADVAGLAASVYDAARPAGVRELWRSAPIPPGPLLCRPAVDVPCAEIAEDLMAAGEADATVMTALRGGWPEYGDASRFARPQTERLAGWAAMLDAPSGP